MARGQETTWVRGRAIWGWSRVARAYTTAEYVLITPVYIIIISLMWNSSKVCVWALRSDHDDNSKVILCILHYDEIHNWTTSMFSFGIGLQQLFLHSALPVLALSDIISLFSCADEDNRLDQHIFSVSTLVRCCLDRYSAIMPFNWTRFVTPYRYWRGINWF